jgi:hypothetical protein
MDKSNKTAIGIVLVLGITGIIVTAISPENFSLEAFVLMPIAAYLGGILAELQERRGGRV